MENAIERTESVFPADFLSFAVRSWIVLNCTFINAVFPFRDIGGDLRFEAETVFFQSRGDFLNHFPAEQLVAGFHVRDVEVGEHIGAGREGLVHPRVPEIENPSCARTEITRAEHHIGFSGEHRFQQDIVVFWCVFHVRILDADIVAGGFHESCPEGRALALVDLMMCEFDFRMFFGEFLRHAVAVVFGTVVHNHDLQRQVVLLYLQNPLHDVFERLFLIVAWNDQAEFYGHAMLLDFSRGISLYSRFPCVGHSWKTDKKTTVFSQYTPR
ncbi:hypothetical protein SDC9_120291 [bioreactor metagenome]|uniref:Uncharacterized protein n=1 Tax=bioreactor metagenome TaxID=1076179 RepID=A0A645C816_9ZZZZ